jgi:hypothetical protein
MRNRVMFVIALIADMMPEYRTWLVHLGTLTLAVTDTIARLLMRGRTFQSVALAMLLAACAKDAAGIATPGPEPLRAPPLTDVDPLTVQARVRLSREPVGPSLDKTPDPASKPANSPPANSLPVAIGVAVVSHLPLDGASAVIIRRMGQWPHDVILLTPATTTVGVLSQALQALGIEHHRRNDVPDHDYAVKVIGTSVPANRRGTLEERFTAMDIVALKASAPRGVAGIGDVPAIVVHMAPTP